MSCGRTQHLEAVVLGETSHAAAADLRAHAQHCARCKHELNWLESESALFRQRAGRDEVEHLWRGVATRRGLASQRPWGRVLMAMAAAVFVTFGLARIAPPHVTTASVQEALESEMLMSPVLELDACSKLPSGMGFSCAPPVPASFIASR